MHRGAIRRSAMVGGRPSTALAALPQVCALGAAQGVYEEGVASAAFGEAPTSFDLGLSMAMGCLTGPGTPNGVAGNYHMASTDDSQTGSKSN